MPLAQLAAELDVSLRTMIRYEQRGGPRWLFWALRGIAQSRGIDPNQIPGLEIESAE